MIAEHGSVAPREVAAAAGVTRQTAHSHLADLVEAGRLVREGRGRATRYRASSIRRRFRFRTDEISEDRALSEIRAEVPWMAELEENAADIIGYAFTEMVNNAMEHSGAEWVDCSFAPGDPDREQIVVTVEDEGVGIFDHLVAELKLEDRLAALQELSKGKVTTAPETHTGEGIFFTSKAVDVFEIDSGGIRWVVDNERGDTAVGTAPPRRGTLVRFEVDPGTDRRLAEIFDEYTDEFEFSRTRTVIKLFTYGVRFISRSEAKRLLRNLDRFREVVLDFEGVRLVGQGFVDEVFRVWARKHPETELTPVNMSPEVEFMVRRGMPADRGE